MTLDYFKSQIKDELDGAKEYIDKALESKFDHPMWSRAFVNMAEIEISHAENLKKMLEMFIKDLKKKEPMSSSAPEDTYKECMKEISEAIAYVDNMKRGL